MNTKVRFVRCPRCRNVLPEPPGVPVYKCGGCGTALQAKKPKNGSDDQVVDNSSNQEPPVNSISHGDRDVAMKSENNTIDEPSNGVEGYSSGKRKMEQLSDDQEAASSSNQESVVTSIDKPRDGDHNDVHTGHEDPESLPEIATRDIMNQDEDITKMQLSDDREACSSSHQQSLVKSINDPDRNTGLNDPRSSTELSGHEDPESSPEATTHNGMDQDQDHDQDQDYDQDQDQDQEKEKDYDQDQDQEKDYDHDHDQDQDQDYAHDQKEDHSSGKQKMEQLSDDQESDNRLNQRSMVASFNEPVRKSDSYEPHCSSELSYHEDPESSPEATVHNRMDQDHDQDYDQEMFAINKILGNHKIEDEFEESSSFSELNEIEEPSREAISNIKIVRDSDGGSKSSFKSLIAEKLLDTRQKKVVYLDDDDTISEDGSADLRHRQRFERVSSTETLENVRFGGTSYYGYEGSISSFDGNDNQIPRKNHIGPRGGENVHFRNGHRYKRHNGQKDEHRSMDVRSFYGNISPLRHGMNEFHENPRHRSSMIHENPKMERLELLKMVQELQDQLERTNVSNVVPQVPSYAGRYGRRMAFSGETTAVNRQRDGGSGSCYHCCPQDRHLDNRHFSAQLPRQCGYCNGPGPRYGPTTYYSSHCSGSSSPQHHSEPEDHRRLNDVRKQYRSPKKRYIRPIAGGSPWIICYRCSQLIQLPESFLVFKRRCHSVRCGGCMKVLNFTLSNGTHVSRYYPEEMIAAPPSSEVEEYANSRAGPVSCSDRSFQKSYSTETDRNVSREFIDGRKVVMSRDPSGSAGPSYSKVSGRRKIRSEIEEVKPVAGGGSPLHWLMGYASPSKVIRG